VTYRTELFDADGIEQFTEHFVAALAQLTADPGIRISQCEAAGARRPVPELVPLKLDGRKPPLFFVHAVGGSVTPYVMLASLLGADQPCYGLEHPGLSGDQAGWSVSELAAGYLAVIQEVQPVGPYHLGGWSFGGLVAMEMARQLRGRGAEVAVVLVLDSSLPPVQYSDIPEQAELLSWFADDVAALAGTAPPPLDLAGLTPDQQIDVTLTALEPAGLGSAAIRAELRNRINVFLANSRAHLAHQLDPYDGRLVLLRAADEPDDDTERWRALAQGSFECYPVRGTHYTVLEPPHVTEVAGVMRRCLGESAAPSGEPFSCLGI
jgi:thioesterase domain-containing protein